MCMHINKQISTCVYIYICACGMYGMVCKRIRVCVYIYIYIHRYICVCVYIYIYILCVCVCVCAPVSVCQLLDYLPKDRYIIAL